MNAPGKKMNIHKSEVMTVIFFLFIVGLFSLGLTLLQVNISAYAAIQNNINALQNTYQTNDSITRSIAKGNIDLHAFTDVLPTQNTVLNWVEQTETIASLTNVQQTLTFANGQLTKNAIIMPPQSGETLGQSVSGNIVIKGPYNNVLSYIDMLESDYYYTRIDGITFSSSSTSSPSTTTPPTPTPSVLPVGQVSTNLTFHLFVNDLSSTSSH